MDKNLDKCEPVAELSAQWVIDFIGSNYNSMRTHDEQGNELALDDITYSLTVHDLLSAFAYTSPQPREWVGLSEAKIESLAIQNKYWYGDNKFDWLAYSSDLILELKQLNTKG